MKIACGLVRPTSGTVSVYGAPAGSREARRRLGYLAELFRFPGWCTAAEVLALHQRLAGSARGESERDELLELVGLVVILARGKVVADGRPEELTHTGGVEIQTGNGTRRFPDARREDVPKIVADLVSAGVDVYEVTIVRSTLEDAYLEAVDPS